ncbi:MAG: type II toxin-antitoxin system PemK/MazF family toxin [Bdellovibrionales bacterium]
MKDFETWHRLKQILDNKDGIPTFSEREIWWCSVGANIGFEIYGKGKVFTRPVIVIRKFGKSTFLGAPLTSNPKEGYYRYPYKLLDQNGMIVLDQIRTYDAKRLVNTQCIQKVHPSEFAKIKRAIKTRFNL